MSGNLYNCSDCGRQYRYNRNLRQHVMKAHPGKVNDIAPLKICKKHCNLKCKKCGQSFKRFRNLIYHERKIHNAENASEKNFKCPLCDFRLCTKRSLFSHVHSEHGVDIECEDFEFPSFKEFMKWKENVEKETVSRYVKECGSKRCADKSTRHYFVCHRSGVCHSKGDRAHKSKTNGSYKMVGVCPANMRVVQREDGVCKISFVSTHVGHDNGTDGNNFGADAANKVPFRTILDKVRDSVSASKLYRSHLLTRKDLSDIEHWYSLRSASCRTDGNSIDAWVYELQSSDTLSVLFYKPQNTVSELQPELKKNDFVLVIMNNSQCDILRKYGGDCVCIDGTHSADRNRFKLVALLVLNDTSQGFPCAFLVSNRNDQPMLTFFFECVKAQVGVIRTKVFMSDVAEAFFDAWVSAMGPPAESLYCPWHVDKVWRKSLSKVCRREKKIEVYRLLRTLMEEPDHVTFEMMVHAATNHLCNDADTADFGGYFHENYIGSVRSWARCYRSERLADAGAHMERVHRTLKYVYSLGKNGKCLDKAVFALMKFLRDNLASSFPTIMEGTAASLLVDVISRHESSLLLDASVEAEEPKGWKVTMSHSVNEYHVWENRADCACGLTCEECTACIHRYACTCLDSCVKWNMCPHIHLVCRTIAGDKPAVHEGGRPVGDEHCFTCAEDDFGVVEEVVADLDKGPVAPADLDREKERVREDFLCALDGVSTASEVEVVKQFAAALRATLAVARKSPQTSDQSTGRSPAAPRQRRSSTKQKKASNNGPVVKPVAESGDIVWSLFFQE